jgi:NAD(P)-dependent dehydrogenase (short-subunit alcohol dehydrogenase family)
MAANRIAIVVGVGPEAGLGGALCKRFGREGLHVFVAGRTPARIEEIAGIVRAAGGQATAHPCDTTVEADVIGLFDAAARAAGGAAPELVAFNAGNNRMANLVEMEASFFEDTWRVACFGGFLVGREAARRMLPAGRGSVLFTGATGSLRGKPPFTAFASAKAGLRALAQAMAREFGPQGIHVAHVIVDGGIDGERLRTFIPAFVASKGEEGLLKPEAIADAYWFLHTQDRTAWTHELDLRPYREAF